jgi:hypothetical protein
MTEPGPAAQGRARTSGSRYVPEYVHFAGGAGGAGGGGVLAATAWIWVMKALVCGSLLSSL